MANIDALNRLYQSTVGRNVDKGGFDYWNEQLNQGTSSIASIKAALMGSTEYKDRAAAVANAGDTGITESQLDNLSSAYKGDYATLNDQHAAAAAASISRGSGVHDGTVPKYNAAEQAAADASYRGAAETGYNKTVPTFTGGYRKDSKNDRSAENLYQQNILDELTKYAQQSGLGNFATSDGSTPQWMPTDASRESIIDPHYRNQSSRATEDLWQQGQISDLEKWAASITGSGQYDLSFNPSEVYHGYGKDGTTYSEHTNEGKRRNISQSSGIDSLIDFISKLDTARGPELDAEKNRLSNIYGLGIDNTYRTLFETDDEDSEYYGETIDPAGKEYWIKDLIENRPGLSKGQDWQTWLSDAFKNTNSYKDFLVNKGPEHIDTTEILEEVGVVGGTGSTGTGSALTDYSNQLQKEKDSWDIKFNDLTNMYTDQMNDLKATFEQSNREQAKLFKGYQDSVAQYRADLNAQAAYGERPMNQTVKGVKTKNELPGFKPSTGGTTGHFNRSSNRITNSSLNIA